MRAFTSNWVFGLPPNGTLRLLQGTRGDLDDPLINRSRELTSSYGGVKENQNYQVLFECIEEYLEREPLLGLLLHQNYAYMMSGETVSFRERNGFNEAEWRFGSQSTHPGTC